MEDRFIFGNGALNFLPDLLARWNPRRVFLVTGRASYDASPANTRLRTMLEARTVLRHSEFEVNVRAGDLAFGTQLFSKFQPDFLLAIGGGSVLDTAKLLGVLPPDKQKIRDMIESNTIPERTIPFVAIPTTAGSGSEATRFAVVYVDGVKYAVAGGSLLPDVAIVDPELTYSMPPRLTAVTAFDAFGQAVESFWSVNSTADSRALSSESVVNVLEVIDRLVTAPDAYSREKMMKAALLSGQAINITKTTGAHAISYTLTMNYGIPHGHAVVLTLPQFLIHSARAAESAINAGLSFKEHQARMADLFRLLGTDRAEDAAERIRQMVRKAGLATRLRDLGADTREELGGLVGQVNVDRLSNNPVKVTDADLRRILNAVW